MRNLPLFPLRDVVLFPYMVVPLFVGREKSIRALDAVMAGDKQMLFVAQKAAQVNDPGPEELFGVGTIAAVIHSLRLPDLTYKLLVEGKQRARIERFTAREDYFEVEATGFEEDRTVTPPVEKLMRAVKATFETYLKLNKRLPPELLGQILSLTDPARLADTIAAHTAVKVHDKQAVLEMQATPDRLEKLDLLMKAEIEILRVERKIRSRVKKQMDQSQKESYLNDQVQAIQKELAQGELKKPGPGTRGLVFAPTRIALLALAQKEKAGQEILDGLREAKDVKSLVMHAQRILAGDKKRLAALEEALENAQLEVLLSLLAGK